MGRAEVLGERMVSRKECGGNGSGPSIPRTLSISPPLAAELGHGGDGGVHPGEREAGKKNGVVGLDR
jgi:hypothetical protein